MVKTSKPADEALLWLLAGGLGFLVPVLLLPVPARWMTMHPVLALLAEAAGFFGLGALMGSLRPERPWRWAVAAVVPAGVQSLAVSALPKSISGIQGNPLLLALTRLPNLVLLGFVTLAGASLAVYALTDRDQSLRSRLAASITWIVIWSAVLGSTGFAAGFFGPLILRPGSNQGPLLGIFITGPLGAVAGVALGVILSAVRSWRPTQRVLWIAVSCVLYLAGILVFTASSR